MFSFQYVAVLAIMMAVVTIVSPRDTMDMKPREEVLLKQIETTAMVFQNWIKLDTENIKIGYEKAQKRFLVLGKNNLQKVEKSANLPKEHQEQHNNWVIQGDHFLLTKLSGGFIIGARDVETSPAVQSLLKSNVRNFLLEPLVVYLMFERSDPHSTLKPLFDLINVYTQPLPLLLDENQWKKYTENPKYAYIAQKFAQINVHERNRLAESWQVLYKNVFSKDSLLFPPSEFIFDNYVYCFAIMQRLLWNVNNDVVLVPLLAALHFSSKDSCFEGYLENNEFVLKRPLYSEQNNNWKEIRLCSGIYNNGDLLINRGEASFLINKGDCPIVICHSSSCHKKVVHRNPVDCISTTIEVINAMWKIAKIATVGNGNEFADGEYDINEGKWNAFMCINQKSFFSVLLFSRILSLGAKLEEFDLLPNILLNHTASLPHEFYSYRLMLMALKTEIMKQEYFEENTYVQPETTYDSLDRVSTKMATTNKPNPKDLLIDDGVAKLILAYGKQQKNLADRIGYKLVEMWNAILKSGVLVDSNPVDQL